jgi:hypothetical protein
MEGSGGRVVGWSCGELLSESDDAALGGVTSATIATSLLSFVVAEADDDNDEE